MPHASYLTEGPAKSITNNANWRLAPKAIGKVRHTTDRLPESRKPALGGRLWDRYATFLALLVVGSHLAAFGGAGFAVKAFFIVSGFYIALLRIADLEFLHDARWSPWYVNVR
jgi:hypothetical protein